MILVDDIAFETWWLEVKRQIPDEKQRDARRYAYLGWAQATKLYRDAGKEFSIDESKLF